MCIFVSAVQVAAVGDEQGISVALAFNVGSAWAENQAKEEV